MNHTLAIKNKEGEWERYNVPEEVAIYVKQLEHAIEYPDQSNIKQIYKERFN